MSGQGEEIQYDYHVDVGQREVWYVLFYLWIVYWYVAKIYETSAPFFLVIKEVVKKVSLLEGCDKEKLKEIERLYELWSA